MLIFYEIQGKTKRKREVIRIFSLFSIALPELLLILFPES